MRARPTYLADGRYLIFYDFDREPWTTVVHDAPEPTAANRLHGNQASELRWNPLLGEWVIAATHRQNRTFLPPADFCPFCPTRPGEFETEVPSGAFDVAVLENRFPSLLPDPGTPEMEPSNLYSLAPGRGICEVVLYSARHELSLAQEPVEQIYKLVLVWTSRFRELGRLEFLKYIFIFENKGEAIGVTLHHPHGQIYGYPFIPPVIQRELDRSRQHWTSTNRCLICDICSEERRLARRVVVENESFVAYIPFFARWPYEVHIAAVRHLQSLEELTPAEQRDLATTLKSLLVAYDALFDIPFPYMMVMHQRPSDNESYDYYHFHIEFYPPLRSRTRLKYLAGSESGAGVFVNDTRAENTANELRAHIKLPVWPGAPKPSIRRPLERS